MKKIFLSLVLSGVSTVALAQKAVLPGAAIVELVKQNVMSSTVKYQGEPSVRAIKNGFNVSVPAGTTGVDDKQIVPAYTFTMLEDGSVGANKRYTAKLNKMEQIFPSLDFVMRAKNVTYSSIDYVGKFIPALVFVESQELVLNNLNMPMTQEQITAKVGQIRFVDNAKMLSDTKVKQENTFTLKDVTLSHPFAALHADLFEIDVNVPEVSKSSSPWAQVLTTPSLQEKMTLTGAKLSSVLTGGEQNTVSFNLVQDLNVEQNQANKDIKANLRINADNIQSNFMANLPFELKVDVTTQGYTLDEMMAYSNATGKMDEMSVLADSPRKTALMKTAQDQVDKAYDNLIDNMKINIQDLSVRASDYALALKGVIDLKAERFKGTLQITNFEYFAPTPKQIDEVACQKLVDDMMSNAITKDAFKAEYAAKCDKQTGVLDALRPYADTATKVKDAQGKDALLFAVEIQNENMFINGRKVQDDSIVNPMSLIED